MSAIFLLAFLIILIPYLILQGEDRIEAFKNGTTADKETDQGIITQPPNPDVTASPAPSQPMEAEPAFLASAPGVVPGAAEISQGTTAFITNTPSPALQQFADSLIITSDQANSAYKDILQFLSQNPIKSTEFLEDIRTKFFDNNCKYRPNINFKELAQTQNMVFRN